MFCDGKCDNGKGKRCGLFANLTVKNDLTGDIKQIERCVFWGIMESLHRQEQGQIRIQAAVELDRNETAKQMENINDTLTKGALGLLRAAQEKLLLDGRYGTPS